MKGDHQSDLTRQVKQVNARGEGEWPVDKGWLVHLFVSAEGAGWGAARERRYGAGITGDINLRTVVGALDGGGGPHVACQF